MVVFKGPKEGNRLRRLLSRKKKVSELNGYNSSLKYSPQTSTSSILKPLQQFHDLSLNEKSYLSCNSRILAESQTFLFQISGLVVVRLNIRTLVCAFFVSLCFCFSFFDAAAATYNVPNGQFIAKPITNAENNS